MKDRQEWQKKAIKITILFFMGLFGLFPWDPILAQEKAIVCPDDPVLLTDWLLRDLPGYANRVILRSRDTRAKASRMVPLASQLQDRASLFVVLAGKPEFEPILLPNRQFTPALTEPESTQQIFFTTLEHQYASDRVSPLQNYYWLFLAKTQEGWRLVILLSQLASLRATDPPLPPQEVTNGIIGQATQLWLRDCRAGSLLIQRSPFSTQRLP